MDTYISEEEREVLISHAEKKPSTLTSFLTNIDKRIIILGITTIAIMTYFYTKDSISKSAFLTSISIIIIILFIMGVRETKTNVIPIEEAMPLIQKKLEMMHQIAGDDVEIKLDTAFILHHWDSQPGTYEIRYYLKMTDGNTKMYTAELDSMTRNLTKNKERKEGWTPGDITNVIPKTYIIPDSELLKQTGKFKNKF